MEDSFHQMKMIFNCSKMIPDQLRDRFKDLKEYFNELKSSLKDLKHSFGTQNSPWS